MEVYGWLFPLWYSLAKKYLISIVYAFFRTLLVLIPIRKELIAM